MAPAIGAVWSTPMARKPEKPESTVEPKDPVSTTEASGSQPGDGALPLSPGETASPIPAEPSAPAPDPGPGEIAEQALPGIPSDLGIGSDNAVQATWEPVLKAHLRRLRRRKTRVRTVRICPKMPTKSWCRLERVRLLLTPIRQPCRSIRCGPTWTRVNCVAAAVPFIRSLVGMQRIW